MIIVIIIAKYDVAYAIILQRLNMCDNCIEVVVCDIRIFISICYRYDIGVNIEISI